MKLDRISHIRLNKVVQMFFFSYKILVLQSGGAVELSRKLNTEFEPATGFPVCMTSLYFQKPLIFNFKLSNIFVAKVSSRVKRKLILIITRRTQFVRKTLICKVKDLY